MPPRSSADRRFLELHRNKWRVVVPVPRDLQKTVGSTKLKVPLPTDSLAEANRLKWPIVGDLKDRIKRLQSPESAEAEALSLAALRRRLEGTWQEDQREAIDTVILERAEAIAGPPIGVQIVGDREEPQYDPKRLAAALEFAGVAQGRRTPITTHRDAWLKQLDVKPRTRADDERAFKWFREWCEQKGIPAFLETLNGHHAVDFTDHLRAKGDRSVVTLNKYVTRLRLYWKWLKGRHVVSTNIWEGRSYTEPFRTAEEKERPFTDDEVFVSMTVESGPCIFAQKGPRFRAGEGRAG